MQAKVINPYAALGADLRDALDFIIANLPPDPTFTDLNEQLVNFYITPDPDNPNASSLLSDFTQTILPHAYNAFVNAGAPPSTRHSERSEESPNKLSGEILRSQSLPQNDGSGYWRYSASQMQTIGAMLKGINSVPVESIGDYLGGIEEEIASGKFSIEEQVPLLIAAAYGKGAHEYWMAQITTPGAWAVYLNADIAINYMHVAGWVSAAMQGALFTYGVVRPPQIQLLDIFSSGFGATGLSAGKVLFKWV